MKYVVKKIITLIITLLVVSMLAFLAFEIIPGDPATSILGTEATEAKVDALREEMGLNAPLPIRYVHWVSDFAKGDMGTSYSYQIPVREMIGDKLPITVTLTVMAFVFILLLAIPLGIVSARYEHTWLDSLLFALNQFHMSVPPFFVGIVFTVVFGLGLRWFVPGGYVSYKDSVPGFLGYLLFPALAVALPKAAMTMKLLRAALLEEKKQDYAKTAYSRGNTAWQVLLKHLFRNGMLSVITFLGMAVADMIANSIIVEQVFGIPGIGRILLTSISGRDYPVVLAIVMLVATIILVINAVMDVVYHQLDKRIEVVV